jgi:translation initiation factor 1
MGVMSRKKRGGLVYSSEEGQMCPRCERPMSACRCAGESSSQGASDGPVRVGRETKGRKGKGVTIVTGVPLAGAELKAFVKELKARCGSGGTIKDGVIEIQGEHRDTIVAEIEKRGWTVKRAGG